MRIQVETGTFSNGELNMYHLQSWMKAGVGKAIDIVLYAEQRFCFTMLVSGAFSKNYHTSGYLPGYSGSTVATRIPAIPMGSINGKEVKTRVYGRIQRAVTVVGTAEVGTIIPASNTRGGEFSLVCTTNELAPEMVTTFPAGKQARVLSEPKRWSGGFLYTFQTAPGQTFTWATWMGTVEAGKKLFGGYTSVGERSRKGYTTFYQPNTYINHTITQRKGFNLSGDALVKGTSVKYTINGGQGEQVNVITSNAEVIARRQFNLEREMTAWKSYSTMRDAFGNLLDVPYELDERGNFVYRGDGVEAQISGYNDVEASGAGGKTTWADLESLVRKATSKREPGYNNQAFVLVVGKEHANHIHTLHVANVKANVTLTQIVTPSGTDDPALLEFGFRSEKLTIAGETVYMVINHMMSDPERSFTKLADGSLVWDYTGYLFDFTLLPDGGKNLTMSAVRNDQVDRELVMGWFDGMTGKNGVSQPLSPVDELAYEMLSEVIVTVGRPETCGIIYPKVSEYVF
jgi:hypothetical protein